MSSTTEGLDLWEEVRLKAKEAKLTCKFEMKINDDLRVLDLKDGSFSLQFRRIHIDEKRWRAHIEELEYPAERRYDWRDFTQAEMLQYLNILAVGARDGDEILLDTLRSNFKELPIA